MSNRALAFTAERLLHILRSLPAADTYVVGFSGGADSTALLHALASIRADIDLPVSAVHVNHGIHPEAVNWQHFCENFCRQLGIELTCLDIKLDKRSGKGLEAEARHLRYEAISGLLGPGDCLLTAHHADDQAETLLLNLMRGSGVEGLTAMPSSRPLGEGFLHRPLLQFKNSALKEYLRKHDVEWIEDPSNQSMNHDRNFVRYEVIPLLERRWPEVSQRLLLTREAMSDARRLLEALAEDYLASNLVNPFVLVLTRRCLEKPELLKLVIRYWIKQSDAPGIPAYKLGTLCDQVRQDVSGRKVALHWEGWSLRLYRDQLWLQPESVINACPSRTWPDDRNWLDLDGDIGRLTLTPTGEATDAINAESPDGELVVGNRNDLAGQSIFHGGVHKRLKNIFQLAGIPHWLRDSIPLCSLDGELAAVGDWCLSDRFTRWLKENSLALKWRPIHPMLRFVRNRQQKASH
jgi:tRNA(Ile)-lysidine synthase